MLCHILGSIIILEELVVATVLPSEHKHFYQSPKLAGVTLQLLVFPTLRALNLTGQYFFVIVILEKLLL